MKRKNKIRFITLYSTFSEKEKEEFGEYITCSLFNKGRNYKKILSLIKLDSPVAWKLKLKSDRTWWNRLSELSLLAEKFLILKAGESNKYFNELLLLKEFKKRNLLPSFRQKYSNLRSEIIKESIDISKYDDLYKIDKLYLNYLETIADIKKLVGKSEEINDYRLAIFLLELLTRLIEVWNQKNRKHLNSFTITEEIFRNINFENILLHMKNNRNSLYQLILFHYSIYLAMNNPGNKEHYLTAKKIFFNKLKSISSEIRLTLYKYLINYNIDRINLSDAGANEETFYLINSKIKEGLMGDIENKGIPINHFRDYILIAIILKKYNWADKFITKFGPMLPYGDRDDNVNIAKARILFNKKNYKSSKEYLDKVKKTNPFHYVDVAKLNLMVLYELKNFNDCVSELKKLTEYLRKERKVQNHLIIYMKIFCYSYSLLLKLREKPTTKNFNNLEFELSKGAITGRTWIKERMKNIVVKS